MKEPSQKAGSKKTVTKRTKQKDPKKNLTKRMDYNNNTNIGS